MPHVRCALGDHLTAEDHAVMGRPKIALEQFDAAAHAATEDLPCLNLSMPTGYDPYPATLSVVKQSA